MNTIRCITAIVFFLVFMYTFVPWGTFYTSDGSLVPVFVFYGQGAIVCAVTLVGLMLAAWIAGWNDVKGLINEGDES